MRFILIFLIFWGCGKNIDHSANEKEISTAQYLIDNKKFEEAINILEPLSNENPKDKKIKLKLFHSYAGAGTFEALRVLAIWRKIEVALKEFRQPSDKETISVSLFIQELEKLLAPIPKLTAKENIRLAQAINLYQEMGLEIEAVGRYRNFKWGALHIYRLAVNLKEIIHLVQVYVPEEGEVDLRGLEKVFIPKVGTFGRDFFMSYQLFSKSYPKIQKVSDYLDRVIAKTINKKFKLKINTLTIDEDEFFKQFLRDNIEGFSILLKKLFDVYKTHDQKNNSKEKLEALFKMTMKILVDAKTEIDESLQKIFTHDFKTKIATGIKDSIRLKSAAPLKELLALKQHEFSVLRNYYLILKGEIDESGIEDSIRDDIRRLGDQIEREIAHQ